MSTIKTTYARSTLRKSDFVCEMRYNEHHLPHNMIFSAVYLFRQSKATLLNSSIDNELSTDSPQQALTSFDESISRPIT